MRYPKFVQRLPTAKAAKSRRSILSGQTAVTLRETIQA
jgi:hypothetical protein